MCSILGPPKLLWVSVYLERVTAAFLFLFPAKRGGILIKFSFPLTKTQAEGNKYIPQRVKHLRDPVFSFLSFLFLSISNQEKTSFFFICLYPSHIGAHTRTLSHITDAHALTQLHTFCSLLVFSPLFPKIKLYRAFK